MRAKEKERKLRTRFLFWVRETLCLLNVLYLITSQKGKVVSVSSKKASLATQHLQWNRHRFSLGAHDIWAHLYYPCIPMGLHICLSTKQ